MTRPSATFGSLVLDLHTLKQHISKSTFQALTQAIEQGTKLPLNDANVIAHAMMEWALSKGASHYTHWFQPMTGRTAQKHDGFLSLDGPFKAIERFSGAQLIQSEPDASSFPSGGMRSTFEARGYTAWDPSSPAFIMRTNGVSVLCIPSVFISYTGHTLDKKTPLLRSIKALNRAARRSLELLGEPVEPVFATVGSEQEYFLVDQTFYRQRPDLIMAGRTLIGSQPPKGQQMEDHYFGSIKDRVLKFMEEVEKALYELGVPCKTRHNEVAPHQFEMAPIFVEANLAADQNQMVMEVLQKKASEFGLHVLLHEKPFAEVNGNGKHLNWSMATKSGINLLEPGQEPHANLRFLYVLVAILDGVHRHGGVLRASIASAGNDHRLGANEAPPAIISVFTGSHLNQILTKLENSEELTSQALEEINLGLEELPNVAKDNTDRNRTSPFAFTGNKFEFRAVGGAQSISLPTTLLNAAVAQALNQLNEEIAALGPCDDKAILKVLSEHIAKSKAIRFEGNNYAKEWQDEAARRGLPHFPNTPTALDCWEWPQTIELLTSLGIMNEDEIKARLNIKREGYAKTIDIEAFTLLRLVDTHVAPSALRYQLTVAKAYDETEDILGESCLAEQKGLLTKLSQTLNQLLKAKSDLEIVLGEARSNHDPKIASSVYGEKVLPTMNYLRSFADELEKMVDSREWDLPTYHELLFLM